MAPTNQEIEKRYCSGYGYSSSYDGCYYSTWDAWGRWALLAAIIIGAFILYFIFARRRRKAGRNPYPMTGWVSHQQSNPTTWTNQPSEQGYHSQQQGYNQGGQNVPPPQYGQPQYGQQQYGQQQYGVAEPQPVYGVNRDMGPGHYASPEGAPPGKKVDQ